jgi:hypothetical protein
VRAARDALEMAPFELFAARDGDEPLGLLG